MILTNTRNRDFIKADVEMLILAARGIGLQIKHLQDTATIREQEQLVAKTESMRDLVHQIGAPLHGIKLHISNIVNRRLDDSRTGDRLVQINQMIKHSTRQLKRFQKILELDTQPITPNFKSLNLPRFLIGRSRDFQGLSLSKGIAIHVSDEHNRSHELVTTDEDLLSEVMNNLIDNAVKYSFNARQMAKHSIKFDPMDVESDGNIQIVYDASPERIMVRITNWGAQLLEEEKSRVFERHFRGIHANDFSPIGSGIGLYLVKKILDALNGSIKITTRDKFITSFTIVVRNESHA